MSAIILAAGRGSRLLDLTKDLPKCMVQLNGRELLHRQIDSLRNAGVRQIGIVTGYKRETIQTYCDTEFHNSHWNETNMVKSLIYADELLSKKTTIISYSDIFYTKETVIKLLEHPTDHMVLSFDPNWLYLWQQRFDDPILDAETFTVQNGVLTDIGGKITNDLPKGQYMGLFKLTPNTWGKIKKILNQLTEQEVSNLDMTTLISLIIKRGVEVHAIPVIGEWGEVDHPSDLKLYERLYPNL